MRRGLAAALATDELLKMAVLFISGNYLPKCLGLLAGLALAALVRYVSKTSFLL